MDELHSQVAGNLIHFLPQWRALTSDPFILQCVSGVKLQFTSVPHQVGVPREYLFNLQNETLLQIEVDKLISRGIVSKVERTKDLFVSNIFSRPKPNGSIRVIVDLTELNNHLVKEHFKMDHIEVAVNMITPGSFMASIDLTDAYYSVPLHPAHKKFICFIWKGEIYMFNCMPFGLSPAPRIFTKILKPLFANFREQGGHGFSYIDDSFIWGPSALECKKSISYLEKGLQDLGFSINYKKSSLNPQQSMVFLGYIIDTVKMEVRPTRDKIEGVKQKIKSILRADTRWFTIRDVASLLGTLVDLTKGVDYGLAHYKNLERCKIWGLIKQNFNLNKSMKISRRGLAELQWWWDNIEHRTRLIRPISPTWEITTDASRLGWGAVCAKGRTGGRWSEEELLLHINVLEIKAVLLGLQSFLKGVSNTTVAVRCDNTTAVAYINKMGGTKSVSCNDATFQIWHWAEIRNNWVVASYIPGVNNTEADFESRHFSDNTEWTLNNVHFRRIKQKWGSPDIDLFASRLNHKVPCFASWYPDPGATFTDAFSISWHPFKLAYIFPPFSLMGRCLRKIREDQVNAVVVAPDWQGQPWYSTLLKMATEKLLVGREDNLLPSFPSQNQDLTACPLIIALCLSRK